MVFFLRDTKLKMDHIGLKKGKNRLERTVFFFLPKIHVLERFFLGGMVPR